MEISIEYCGTCNYRPIAAALSLAIREALGVASRLVHSPESGAFKVIADRETIYSKLVTGAFPSKDEVIAVLRRRQNAA